MMDEMTPDFARADRLKIRLKDAVFYAVFVLVFLLSGILTAAPIPYRMGLVSFLVIPLLIFYRPKIDLIIWGFVALVLAIGVSAVVNRSSLLEFLLFLRIPAFAYLTFFLADIYLSEKNVVKLFRFLLILGYIQLPFIFLQKIAYPYLPPIVTDNISSVDFDFGTFNWKGDSSMSLFLILLIVVLLFSPRVRSFTARPGFSAFFFSIAVLIADSRLAHLVLLSVWAAYLVWSLWHVGARKTSSHALAFVALLCVFGYVDVIQGTTGSAVTGAIGQFVAGRPQQVAATEQPGAEGGSVERYLSGGYARAGALRFFISEGISIVGDGPSKYYNALTRARLRGNHGHFFTFYSEVGLVGWGVSVAVFLLMACQRPSRTSIRIGLIGVLLFLVIQSMSFTLEIMNDISAVFSYVLISRYFLLPRTDDEATFL